MAAAETDGVWLRRCCNPSRGPQRVEATLVPQADASEIQAQGHTVRNRTFTVDMHCLIPRTSSFPSSPQYMAVFIKTPPFRTWTAEGKTRLYEAAPDRFLQWRFFSSAASCREDRAAD